MAASSPRRARKRRAQARLSRVSAAGAAIAASALAGCGGVTASTSSAGRTLPLEVSSPALTASGVLPALYTCAGRDISPPIRWGNIPANTAELALFLLDLGHTEPAAGGATQAKLKVAWTVRGLRPTLHSITAGRLPTGAIVGHGRYSICPPKGGTGQYMFRLYALPSRLPAEKSLSDLELFRQINRNSSAAGDLLTAFTRT
jgi:phosphatidylethanolamine-binding protein (PEBP) family uncharacterized protein